MVKKSLLVVLACLMQVFSMFAQDEQQMVKLTFDVDDASRVSISVAGEELNEIKTGVNEVEVYPWSNVAITAAEGCLLKSVVNSAGSVIGENTGSVSIFISDEVTEETYKITTEQVGDIEFSIEVDNPSKVNVCNKNYQPIALEKGVNEIKISALDVPIMIGAAQYGEGLYKVTYNGEEVENNYGYLITPEANSVIVITADFPDKDCKVTFTYAEGSEDFFTAVMVNGEENADFKEGLTVKCGSSIALYYNQYCWQTADDGVPVEIAINGATPQWFGPGYTFVVKDDTTVEVKQAAPTEKITITLEVDDPTAVIVYNGSESFKDRIKLTEGKMEVKLPREEANLVITNVEIGDEETRIEGVTVNGRPKEVSYYNYYELRNLDEGDSVQIFTKGGTSHVENVGIAADARGAVYSITGVKVMENAQQSDVLGLPAGFYIFNGKKIVVK